MNTTDNIKLAEDGSQFIQELTPFNFNLWNGKE
jgi:hypothetical protein